MVAADAEADEGEVGLLALRRRRHLADLELARDHLVPEVGDDLGDPLEPIRRSFAIRIRSDSGVGALRDGFYRAQLAKFENDRQRE